MPGRALIIGIEHYPQSVDLATQITDATAGAEHFFEWLTTVKGVAPPDTYVCASGGTFSGANLFSTEREKIVDAIAAIVAAGQDQTDELFVFFSGHGYCFQESLEKRAIDVLVASDFESADLSGTKCLKLQEIQEKLYAILGGQHHYYFIDACRTLIRDTEIDPIAIGRKLGRRAQRGRPTKYTLYSTAYGTPAAISSDFAPALLDGLHGKGRAKGFTPAGSLYVQFPLLCGYVQQRIPTQKVDQNKDGNGEGYIVEVLPVPLYSCDIAIQGAGPADAFDAKLSVAGNSGFSRTTPFTGGSFTLPFNPGNLLLDVFDGGQPLTRVDPPPNAAIDFFDNCRAVFRKTAPTPAAPAAPPPMSTAPPPPPASRSTMVSMAPMPDVRAEAINLQTGETREIAGNQELPSGDYEVTVRERGVAISRDIKTLHAGGDLRIGDEPLGPIRESIIRAVHGDPARGIVAFSESLGDMANRDLGLWLTLMGTAHILRDPTTFSKLRDLPLVDVSLLPPQSTALYVLGAFDDGQAPRIGVGRAPTPAELVPGLTGVYQALSPTMEGPQLVTIEVGASRTRTMASYCLPNRLTFIVLATVSRGALCADQFLLPMFHLQQYLPSAVQDRIRQHPAPLRIIHTAYTFQSQFGRQREIAPPEAEDRMTWDELLFGKWIDPVMSLLVCYEILRRGNDQSKQAIRDIVVPNLEQYFPGIPDIAAIAELVGLDRPMPAHPSLFREGLLAFPDWEEHLPMAAAKLDFNYMWTTWCTGRR